MPVDHYENFPVASLLLPAPLRAPVAAIYAFARSADDFADEGDLTPSARLQLLDHYRAELSRLTQGLPTQHPVFMRLAPVVMQYHLPVSLFNDLLDAFSQDVVKFRYANFAELEDYCRRSANPVGRIMLQLFGAADETNLRYSDCICTALQLINHWQDVALDWRKNRLYIPQTDLQKFEVSEDDIAHQCVNESWRAMMQFQVMRARQIMLQGAPLGRILVGRIGLEMRAIIQGGLRILEKIEQVDYDVFRYRPLLTHRDKVRTFVRAIRL